MSIALYRKYRPAHFKEVLGQEHIIDALQGSIDDDSISHAYLFSGSRGTGKTSVARIFANSIGTSDKDLYEIDAASNRGIDDVRALREGVETLPFDSTRKVYIIDEVHMLTKEAFNALLKTLEEPPVHVIFVLATTEPQKLPDTIVSRCELHSFRRPSQQMLKTVAEKVAKEEGYTLDSGGADVIAMLGDGSFRDTLGTLQKVLSSVQDKNITTEDVAKVTSAPSTKLVMQIIDALNVGDVDKALMGVAGATKENADMVIFLKLLLHRLRIVLLLRHTKHMESVIKSEVSEDEFTALSNIAHDTSSKIRASVLRELLGAYEQTSRVHIPQLPLELALVKLLGQNES
jgi:DNA polymerase-3 subunit gamma/tau